MRIMVKARIETSQGRRRGAVVDLAERPRKAHDEEEAGMSRGGTVRGSEGERWKRKIEWGGTKGFIER